MRSVFAAVVLLAACTPNEPVTIGASCSATEKIEACAVGKVAVCVGGKWEESLVCPDGCVRKAIGHGSTAPICENAVANADMICTTGGSRICSADGHAQLVCQGRRWKTEKPCPTRCAYPKTGIICE